MVDEDGETERLHPYALSNPVIEGLNDKGNSLKVDQLLKASLGILLDTPYLRLLDCNGVDCM